MIKYRRHYVQFNDLVFDEYDMTSESDSSVSFKEVTHEYSFRHGDYSPNKAMVLVSSGSVSMTLELRMKKLPCDMRPYYRRFVIGQITKPGRLWAVQDNTLVWAWAKIQNYAETERGGSLELDVSFALPEGVWHKADHLRTFLVPYDKCHFMECYDFHDINECACCCDTFKGNTVCCCEDITKDMALCYHLNEMQKFYDCELNWRIVYDCDRASSLFGDYRLDPHFGQKICDCCSSGIIAGVVYSDTDIPTDGVKITIHGHLKNPLIEINGNANLIVGEYDGYLTLFPDGTAYASADPNCYGEELDVSAWQIPQGHDFKWEIHQGDNSVVISTGACSGVACAYIEVDSLTI